MNLMKRYTKNGIYNSVVLNNYQTYSVSIYFEMIFTMLRIMYTIEKKEKNYYYIK